MSPARRLLTSLLLSLTIVGGAAAARAAPFSDPAHRYRTLATDHFSVHFHLGEDALARRLARIAEDVWQQLAASLGPRIPIHTEVVLADQTELSNGFATPLPYDTVVVTAVWPSGSDYLGKTDDWLRLVFTHEFTHIVHLDRSEGWARVVRRVFGRTAIAFPNLYLPTWQVEGIATYEESRLSGEGRLHAGDFGSIVAEAARERRLEPLDRVNGGLIDWPAGNAAYAYGAGFHQYLSDRYGAESLAALADATAGRLPFTGSRAFEPVYGRSLGDLWREYQQRLAARSAAPAPSIGRRLTRLGFSVGGPRFDPAVCRGCPERILYSARTPDGFPAMYEVPVSGGPSTRLARRYLGNTIGVSPGTLYFDQRELRRSTGLYGDLYALDRASGRVRSLTTEARLLDPDLSPDGGTLVAVHGSAGRRELVLLDVAALNAPAGSTAAPLTLASEPDTQFDAPRWSPDGRTIAVERHRLGALSEIAVVDIASHAVRTIASAPGTRFVTPAWRPDGGAIVAAADFEEGPFNLYEIPLSAPQTELRQLTFTGGGATWPDVSRDGTAIAFAGYTADGFDVFVTPYPPPDPSSISATRRTADRGAGDRQASAPTAVPPASAAVAAYNPGRTLKPTSWSPIVEGDRDELRLGAAMGGVDVLGYHAYGASITWFATRPSDAAAPDSMAPDWRASYAYARWRPTFFFSASSITSFVRGPAADPGGGPATQRERQVEAGVLFPIRHVRTSQVAFSSVARASDEFLAADRRSARERTAWRGGWSIQSAHEYGYSIGLEDGGLFGVTTELARAPSGASGSAPRAAVVTADGRLYWSPVARHQVLAVRLAGGISTGDPAAGRSFHLGGAQANASALDLGEQAISLLRGFGSDTFAGSRVALLNAEYRWPVARPQRGVGTWPLFLRTVHAAVFTDLGNSWTRSFAAAGVKTSAGVELSMDLVAGYGWPLTASTGAAWGRDGGHAVPGGATVYVRVGRAF